MPTIKRKESTPDMRPLAYRQAEAAKAIGISEGTLRALTQAGKIPHIKLKSAVLYPVDSLRRWLNDRALESITAEKDEEQ